MAEMPLQKLTTPKLDVFFHPATALFDRIQNELSFYSLPFADHKGAYRALLTRLVAALFILTEDASIRTVAGLLDALLARMPTSAVLSFAEPEMLVAALGAPHPAANLLALDILRRAEGTEGAEVVLEREVVDALVNCWLRSKVVEVAQRGEEAIENLLRRTARGDAALTDAAQRLSLEDDENEEEYVLDMWEDLLRGQAAIAIVDICVQDTDERQASLSQTRLLGLLPRLARLDFPALASATLPRRPASSNTLLQMAIDFVDRDDIAMYLVLVQFYKDLFTQVFAAVSPQTRATVMASREIPQPVSVSQTL
ncbi:unnamed protein product [Parascedosporium putredinis]|uniref:Uncharacterized protein n=1 Tax=Parascedosporium putredinis TaxID=1442378 RepID=A0A9P1H0D7_9PEZI|nr:unnamed protein product [Parascedosporium putredinis]CAI7991673.1 unnamed protein product [Parascedosporium putredinis]